MNPGRFYMPGYMGMTNGSIMSPMMRMANSSMSPIMRMANSAPRSMGLFSRITNGIRSINWSGLLNGANKTLNVVNQAIPLVRQAGPMVNNMKSMMRIAKAFGSETNTFNSNKKNINNSLKTNDSSINNLSLDDSYDKKNLVQKKEVNDDNYPNFFV